PHHSLAQSPVAHVLSVSFFHVPRGRRYLHSFPPRRSSDLITIGLSASSPFIASRTTRSPGTRTNSGPISGRPSGRPEIGPEFVLDRKSTRLNSSHVAISYAVIRLKEKKGIHESAATRAAVG